MNISDWLNVVFFLLFVVQMQSSMAKQEPAPMVLIARLDTSIKLSMIAIESTRSWFLPFCSSSRHRMWVKDGGGGVDNSVYVIWSAVNEVPAWVRCKASLCIVSNEDTWLVTEFVFWWSPVCYEGSWCQGWQKSFGWSWLVAQKSGRYELNKYTRLKAVNLSIKK